MGQSFIMNVRKPDHGYRHSRYRPLWPHDPASRIAPAANPGFANSRPVSQRRRQARMEGVIGQLPKASPNALFRRTIQPIENLLGFVSDANAKTHRPRSRSYSARGFTRPAAR